MTDTLENLLSRNGPVAGAMADYEDRPDQLEMARAVQQCCREGGSLLIEAGTGTGKSLAYLLPILKHSMEAEVRVVVSTCTKTLQSQIVKKELPFLKKSLGWDFRYTLCLGGENYLCLRRFTLKRIEQRTERQLWVDKGTWSKLESWAMETKTGTREETDFPLEYRVWDEVKRTSETCLGPQCKENRRCFFQRARREQYKCNILVVNHHLFFTNLKTEGNLLAPYQVVVFDEAHDLEEVATSLLGLDASTWTLRRFVESLLGAHKRSVGLLEKWHGLQESLRNEISSGVQSLEEEGQAVLNLLRDRLAIKSKGKRRITEPTGLYEFWHPAWEALLETLSQAKKQAVSEEIKLAVDETLAKGTELQTTFKTILEMEQPESVYWAEVRPRKRGPDSMFLAMRPLNVSERFAEVLEQNAATIFVSATLSVGGKFDYFRSRLGIVQAKELILDSPFDFKKNVLLFVDPNAPLPGQDRYTQYLVNTVRHILDTVKGGTFVLFTSHITLREVYEEFGMETNKHEEDEAVFMRQGEISRDVLLRQFRQAEKGVLFGAFSFWQGVDVPGQALECVILTRLPFEVPDEPLVQARMEQLQAEGKAPFWNYQVPNAVIRFRQGFGRLIRKNEDYGVIAVLDSRIIKKYYGKTFLKSIPDCAKTKSLEDIGEFLAGKPQRKK